MTPLYQFVYLDIQGLWPTADETLAREIARVTPAGYGLRGAPGLPPVPPDRPPPSLEELVDMLTPPGVLQICLRTTPLFNCGEGDIVDRRVTPPTPQTCQDQTLLVEELAEALWSYEDECSRYERLPHTIQQVLRTHLAHQQDILMAFELFRRVRALPDQAPSVSRAAREQSYTTLRQVVEALQAVSPDQWHWYAWRRTAQSQRLQRLCGRMRDALRQFGPERYPAVTIRFAMAHILLAFGIETGNEETVANSIRSRLYRFDSQFPPPRA